MQCTYPHPTGQFGPAIVILLLLIAGPIAGPSHSACAAEPVTKTDLSSDIRSIISENCVFCHGPDEATREADLRLDTREGIESVIEKGSAANSELIHRLMSDDPGEVMPPPESNRSVTTSEIARLQQWIDVRNIT